MNLGGAAFVMIPEEDLINLKNTQQEILSCLKELLNAKSRNSSRASYITAKEFMSAVSICRSMFDRLIAENKIKSVKKKRKIYVLATEVDRYFSDPSIQ